MGPKYVSGGGLALVADEVISGALDITSPGREHLGLNRQTTNKEDKTQNVHADGELKRKREIV